MPEGGTRGTVPPYKSALTETAWGDSGMMHGTWRFTQMERVIYGEPFAATLGEQVKRVGANAVYVLSSGTLARETDAVDQIRTALGNRMAGLCANIGAHTPRTDVVAAANDSRACNADLLVTIGGGSVTDAAKMVAFCLGNDITDPSQLDAFAARVSPDGRTERPDSKPPALRSIDIPTTLSAGEFNPFAGCTDTVRQVKQSYSHPLMIPLAVILDPAATVHTPEWLFLSTGLRAVDHAVECVCSVNAQPLSDGTALQSLRLLGRALPAVKSSPSDLDSRLDCQLGAWMSIFGSQGGVSMGASHGIGHVLGGTAGVPHGYTSCIMLPHVLRFNEPVNAERQAWVSEALGRPGEPAADVVAALVTNLGLPGRLRDVGVKQDQLDQLAAESMHDRWVHTNPRPVKGPETVRMLLDAAW